MSHFPTTSLFITLLLTSLMVNAEVSVETSSDPVKASLGELIFADESLSQPQGQSCASCHSLTSGGADRDKVISAGANSTLFGNRNAPSVIYAKYTVDWHFNTEDETWMGGFFLDGRARTMHEQAKGPFLNPLEMGNDSVKQVINKIKQSAYKDLFESIYGKAIWNNEQKAFNAVADSLVEYQNSDSFAPRFTSKYDAYLQGKATLTAQEKRGLELYEAEDKGNCAACHPSQRANDNSLPLFTDFSYDNLGVPKNKNLPFYTMAKKYNGSGDDYVDVGLADNPNIENAKAQLGKFKVPTLRNIAQTSPYMHNGVFTTLKETVEFYNSRDVDDKWGAAEVAENVNKDELGDLKLSEQDVEDLVEFMKTLDDGFIED